MFLSVFVGYLLRTNLHINGRRWEKAQLARMRMCEDDADVSTWASPLELSDYVW